MTAVTLPAANNPAARQAGCGHERATFIEALEAEWVKLRTIQSTYWTLVVAIGLGVGLGALFSALRADHPAVGTLRNRSTWDPTSISFGGLGLASLAIGILGVMVITSEYSSGTIRTSLAAVPHRARFLAAKATLYAAVCLVTGEIMAFAAFSAGQALISGRAPSASLGQPDVLRAVIGAGLYLAVLGVFGVALGALLRNAAGAIAALVAIMFVLPAIATALPTSIQNPIEQYWPTQAGGRVAAVIRQAHTMAAWPGFAVMCLFVGLVLAAAFMVLQRRDI